MKRNARRTRPMVLPPPPAGEPAAVELKSLKRAADTLDLKSVTLRKWIREGRISVVRLGGVIRIPSTEIDRLIAEGFVARRVSTAARPAEKEARSDRNGPRPCQAWVSRQEL